MTILSDAQVIGYAKGAGWTGSDVVTADAIAHAESGLNTLAINTSNRDGSTDYGLMQVNSSHGTLLQQGDWRDPATNMRMAFSVWKAQGWKAWTTYTNGAYSKFMPLAFAASGAPALTGGSTHTATPAVSIGGAVSGVGDFVSAVTNPHTYLRIGMFLIGVFLMFIALVGFSRAVNVATGLVRTAKTAGKAAALA